jgi:Pvc16 N-terminal domain
MNGTHDETIRDVSRTLVDLLKANLPDVDTRIALASPKSAGTNLLTLFLYKVLENPYLKNQNVQLPPPGPDNRLLEQRTPLTVDLYYLLTAHAGEPPDLLEAHRALSRAMRVLYDNGILRGSLLRADDPSRGLTDDSILRVTLNPITMEDLTRIWSVFPDVPYEISLTYLVTPVVIESAQQASRAPVVDQVHDQGHRGPVVAGVRT